MYFIFILLFIDAYLFLDTYLCFTLYFILISLFLPFFCALWGILHVGMLKNLKIWFFTCYFVASYLLNM